MKSQEGFVTVTFNYRLGVLGYLSLNVLSKSDPRGVSGNYGFLDQILALQVSVFILQNFAFFNSFKRQIDAF
jgi:para-nitrobenzyl esterase